MNTLKNTLITPNIKNLGFSWLVWGLAATFYFSDYLARVAPSVMHRSLQEAFNINEAGFGLLISSFYIPYIFMQIPVGLTVDRLSIRNLLTGMSLITGFGCILFGLASTLEVACIGRMLIGFSAAFAFISALRLATSWFPPHMLGLLAGLTQALGMLGASTGEAPVSMLAELVGWRHTMLLMAGLFIILSALLYHFIHDHPDQAHDAPGDKTTLSIIQSLKIVLSNKQTWINALYVGFLYAPTAVIGEAIGAAYLQYGRGLSSHGAAFATGLIFIGWGISGPLSGWLSDRMGRRKPLMICSALCGVIFSTYFVFIDSFNETSACILFFFYGVTNIGVAIGYAVSTEIHQRDVIGTSIAFTNMSSIFVGACLVPIVGYLIDNIAGVRAYNVSKLVLSDFQFGLQLLPLCSLVALVMAFRIKETFCRPIIHS
ncbi:MAG: MFS transporter [Legionellaceae bacterium]|nr:MFS transporter [Legionellaceae bacterium]